MDISYFRSSSYNSWDFCQQQYYLNYVLGIPQDVNVKAQKGTMFHKVMECLALGKLSLQTGVPEIDDVAGQIDTARLYDDDYVDHLLNVSFEHYRAYKPELYPEKDKKEIKKWIIDTFNFNDGMFDPRNRNIFAAEQSFDFQIEEAWADKLRLRGTVDLITNLSDDIIEVIDWKGLPTDTKLPTPNGWTTMGEVKVGDTLFDKDGKQTRVLAKSTKSHKPCFKITFDDKTEAICDNEHIWLLADGTTNSIQSLKINDKIQVTKAIETDNVELPIDPYVLGVWLGDGRNRSGEISSADYDVFREIKFRGFDIGDNISSRPNKICEQRTVVGLTTKLRSLNLLNNKHIPQIYLRASISQRLDLLRGLMDSDGNVNKTRKQCVFTTCNKKLSDDTKELLLSLGQRVNQSHIKRKYKYKDGREICNVYPLHFRPTLNPFFLTRKAVQVDYSWGAGRSGVRTIKNIVLLKNHQETQCLSVDSPSKTYLCTENFIPTHNTGQRKDWATGEEKDLKKLQKDPQLMIYFYALKHLFPTKTIMFTIYFARSGGPFTVYYDDETLTKVSELLEKRYLEIKKSKVPKLIDPSHRDFKCSKLCHYYKNNYEGTSIPICDYIHRKVVNDGIDETTKKFTTLGYNHDSYKAPGE